MYCRHKFIVSARDVSSSPSSLDFKLKRVQVEDTERTPAQNELSTTIHVGELFHFDHNKLQRGIPCKLIILHLHVLNLFMFENDKPAHVASVLNPFWALDCLHL